MFAPEPPSFPQEFGSPVYASELIEQENNTLQPKRQPIVNRKALTNLDLNSLKSESFPSQNSAASSPKPNKLRVPTGSKIGTALVSRRNERERNRVRLLNMGFDRLRAVVPSHSGEQLSKISTLRKAIWYIEHLDRVLHGQDEPSRSASHPATTTISPTLVAALTSTTSLLTADRRGTNRNSVAGVGTGTTSWSSPGNIPRIPTNKGGRPVQKLSSPMFPSRWESGLTNHVIMSTPKFRHHRSEQAISSVPRPMDSGYLSMERTDPTLYNIQDHPQFSPVQTMQKFHSSVYSIPPF